MCGIFGEYNLAGADRALVERMAQRLAHRGPDGFSVHADGVFAFGAGRLAIIDLNAPPGVLFSEDRQTAVAFNGEIYNHRALRAELENAGHHFATRTDTEVIVHGYEQWGRGVLDRLRGMFAVCVWDAAQRSMLLARDRAGEKPLYYAPAEGRLCFASEIKALLADAALPRALNAQAALAYFALGYIPAPHTPFQGVHKLQPGEYLTYDGKRVVTGQYWRPSMPAPEGWSYAESVARTRAALAEAVEMRMMSDVPVGAFLSGGLDSSAVVALMRASASGPVRTFTVGFELPPGSTLDSKFNVDARFAEAFARELGAEHHAITIREDDSLCRLLPHLICSMDEPIAQPSIIQTVFVAALARTQGVPVLLSGDGGDELFAGYPHFRSDQRLAAYLRLPAVVRALSTPLLERLPARFEAASRMAEKSRRIDPLSRYLAWKRMIDPADFGEALRLPDSGDVARALLERSLGPLLAAPQTPHFADRIAYAGLVSWLADDSNMRVDKLSMAMSVESRAPFEDHPLIDLALRIPLEHKLRGGTVKHVLKSAVQDIVPASVRNRPKWGFVPPASEWLRTVLRPLVERWLAPEYVAHVGVMQPEWVQQRVRGHIDRREYHLWPVWTALAFHLWHAVYIDEALRPEGTLTPEQVLSYSRQTTPAS